MKLFQLNWQKHNSLKGECFYVIFNIVKDINKKIAENPELKYSVSITELKIYHDQLLGLLEKFEKIENCNYKTTDFEAKLKNATVIVKKLVLFYENQLNKIYNDDMMDIEVTAKIFKDIIDEYNSMKIQIDILPRLNLPNRQFIEILEMDICKHD